MPDYIKNIKTPDDGVNHGLIPSITPVANGSFGMKAGAALTEGAIVFKSTETGSSAVNKIYAITNTSKYIDPYWGLAIVKKAVSSGTVLSGDYLSQSGVYTYSSASAGIPYALKLTKNSTGYRVSTSTPQNIRSATDGYYIYLGVGETGTVNGTTVKRIACDFSAHMFFRIVSGRIVEINGREIDTLHPSVPVSPESSGFVAGVAITAGQILFRCKTDNKIYPITNTTQYLDLDWGLGIAKVACAADATLSGNNILQQSAISNSSAVEGTDYGLSIVYDGTGYKINTGTLVDIDNVTDGIIIYVGVGNGTEKIDCDFSNHTFFKIENGKISALNGRKITTDDANVPVSVDAKMPPTGESMNNSIVYKCVTDGKLYSIESQSRLDKPVDLDWGIALCKPNIGANVIPENNKVVQKAEIDYLYTLLPNYSSAVEGDDLYFYCSIGNNPIPRGALGSINVYSTGHIGNYSDVKSWAHTYGGCVYMYVGQAIFNSTPQTVTPTAITESQYIPSSETGTGTHSDYQDVHIFTVVPGAKYFVTASYGSGYGSYVANYYDNDGIRIGTEYLQTNNNYVDAELTLPEGTRTIKCNFRKADTAAGMKISRMGISLDTSNHMFFTIDEAAKITEINGVGIYQVTVPQPDYRNPVSGDSLMPVCGDTIYPNSMVYKGLDGFLKMYYDDSANDLVDPDWGLGIYRGSDILEIKDVPANNTIFQQCQWSGIWTGTNIGLDTFAEGDLLYAVFDESTPVNGIKYPAVPKGILITNRDGLTKIGGTLTYCYVGTVVHGERLAVDLSAHQFITEFFDDKTGDNIITHINGVPVGGNTSQDREEFTLNNLSGTACKYGVFSKCLCALDVDGKMTPFTKTGGAGVSKETTDLEFPIGCSVYWFDEDTDITADASFSRKKFYNQADLVPLKYTGNLTYPMAEGMGVYINVNVDLRNGRFKPVNNVTFVISTQYLNNGSYYLYLGKVVQVGSQYVDTMIQLDDNNILYRYQGTKLIPVPYGTTYAAYTGFAVYQPGSSSQAESKTLTYNTTYFFGGNFEKLEQGLYIVSGDIEIFAASNLPANPLVRCCIELQTSSSNSFASITHREICGGFFRVPKSLESSVTGSTRGHVINLSGFLHLTDSEIENMDEFKRIVCCVTYVHGGGSGQWGDYSLVLNPHADGSTHWRMMYIPFANINSFTWDYTQYIPPAI